MVKMLIKVKIHDNGNVHTTVASIKGFKIKEKPETKQDKAVLAFLHMLQQFLTAFNKRNQPDVQTELSDSGLRDQPTDGAAIS